MCKRVSRSRWVELQLVLAGWGSLEAGGMSRISQMWLTQHRWVPGLRRKALELVRAQPEAGGGRLSRKQRQQGPALRQRAQVQGQARQGGDGRLTRTQHQLVPALLLKAPEREQAQPGADGGLR